MAKKCSRGLSGPERAERRRQDRERLQLAAEQLLTSDGWRRWVRVRSQAGLARLSISNQLLVALARPDATFVAGFNTWLRLGFAVRKGERAVAIIAPLPVKERDWVTGEGVSSERFGRDRAEVIVETAAYIVCTGLGLPTDDASIPYIAGWGEQGALDAVTDAATVIDEIASRIEDAIGLESIGDRLGPQLVA